MNSAITTVEASEAARRALRAAAHSAILGHMGRVLGHTAASIGVSERTLRRYVNDGLLRARRVGSQLELGAQEERYLYSHHKLLTQLRTTLRTERNVRLAVLFGSMATGDDGGDSDVDILVTLEVNEPRDLAALRRRIQTALDRRVHLVTLDDASRAPSLLADVLEEGRVLIDRDGLWTPVINSRELVLKRARREEAALMRKAAAAVSAARQRAHA
jgi:predicted nucleotidyltransferase